MAKKVVKKSKKKATKKTVKKPVVKKAGKKKVSSNDYPPFLDHRISSPEDIDMATTAIVKAIETSNTQNINNKPSLFQRIKNFLGLGN